jgi:hypothetical protein
MLCCALMFMIRIFARDRVLHSSESAFIAGDKVTSH